MLAALLASAALSAAACKSRSDAAPAADNTAQNDRDHRTTTAEQTSNRKDDVEVTQQIRKAVMDDSSLSTNAHNCKIVVNDTAVTLVGPVASDAERTRVAEIATRAAGTRSVVNQLEVVR